jgi:hypothetical protein
MWRWAVMYVAVNHAHRNIHERGRCPVCCEVGGGLTSPAGGTGGRGWERGEGGRHGAGEGQRGVQDSCTDEDDF